MRAEAGRPVITQMRHEGGLGHTRNSAEKLWALMYLKVSQRHLLIDCMQVVRGRKESRITLRCFCLSNCSCPFRDEEDQEEHTGGTGDVKFGMSIGQPSREVKF